MRTNAYDERWVDAYTFECGHRYWQEKGRNLEEGICDACLMSYLGLGLREPPSRLKVRMWKIWDNKKVRRFIHE